MKKFLILSLMVLLPLGLLTGNGLFNWLRGAAEWRPAGLDDHGDDIAFYQKTAMDWGRAVELARRALLTNRDAPIEAGLPDPCRKYVEAFKRRQQARRHALEFIDALRMLDNFEAYQDEVARLESELPQDLYDHLVARLQIEDLRRRSNAQLEDAKRLANAAKSNKAHRSAEENFRRCTELANQCLERIGELPLDAIRISVQDLADRSKLHTLYHSIQGLAADTPDDEKIVDAPVFEDWLPDLRRIVAQINMHHEGVEDFPKKFPASLGREDVAQMDHVLSNVLRNHMAKVAWLDLRVQELKGEERIEALDRFVATEIEANNGAHPLIASARHAATEELRGLFEADLLVKRLSQDRDFTFQRDLSVVVGQEDTKASNADRLVILTKNGRTNPYFRDALVKDPPDFTWDHRRSQTFNTERDVVLERLAGWDSKLLDNIAALSKDLEFGEEASKAAALAKIVAGTRHLAQGE